MIFHCVLRQASIRSQYFFCFLNSNYVDSLLIWNSKVIFKLYILVGFRALKLLDYGFHMLLFKHLFLNFLSGQCYTLMLTYTYTVYTGWQCGSIDIAQMVIMKIMKISHLELTSGTIYLKWIQVPNTAYYTRSRFELLEKF